MRGDTLTSLCGDALPLGILEDVEARSSVLRLKAGDRLTLMTDGVEDAFPTKAALTDALRAALAQPDATAAAQSLLESAARAGRPGPSGRPHRNRPAIRARVTLNAKNG